MHDQQTGQMFQPARLPGVDATSLRNRRHATRRAARSSNLFEVLEQRTHFAVATPVSLAKDSLVNVTALLENQHSPAIAVDRNDPGRIFFGAVSDSRGTGPLDDTDFDDDQEPDTLPPFDAGLGGDPPDRGIIGGLSTDGGRNFGIAGLVPNGVSPSVAFDEFGNLFLAFYNRQFTVIPNPGNPNDPGFIDESTVDVFLSTDGGLTFGATPLASFDAAGFAFFLEDDLRTNTNTPQPTVATGAGTVWVCFEDPFSTEIVAAGARVVGLGENSIDEFSQLQSGFRSEGGKFADIAIGPAGQVMIAYEVLKFDPDAKVDPLLGGVFIGTGGFFTTNTEQSGPGEIFVNIDPDGLGPEGFGRRFKATETSVGLFDPIAAQNDKTIDAAPGIVYDRSGGPFNGRVWMVYTDESRDDSDDETDVFVRFSDDDGETWSSPRTVPDDEFARGSQFLPRIALDQTTGNIAITWYDTRVQGGVTFGDNDETQLFGTVGVPTVAEAGVSFASNVQISEGLSEANRSRGVLQFGEYGGLDFHKNVVYPIWADNSNSTGDNPSGGVTGTRLATFDLYTTRLIVTPPDPTTPEQVPVGPGSPLTPQFIGRDTISKGKFYKFQVRFQSPNGVDASSLDDSDLLVTGPNGYNLFADHLKAKRSRGGTIVTGTYIAPAPGGKWDQGDNGLYSILIQGGAIRDLTTTVSANGLLDQFLVSSTAPPQSPAVLPAAPVSAALQPAAAHTDDEDLRKAVGL